LVTEEEIRTAMMQVFNDYRLVIEGAAAVTVAGFSKCSRQFRGKTVVVVICGRNIDMNVFKSIVCPFG
jgi:threonine dehydratase